MNKLNVHPWIYTLLPVLLGVLLIYWPDLKNGFVWDDRHSFFVDPMYRDPANLKRALTGALIYQQNFFRPLPILSFLLQIHVFEISAARMHLVSILLHTFNTFMVMLIAVEFLRRLDKPRVYLSAALTGLIYGLHPALIEPVSFISTRFDMMLTAFLLLALYADARIANQWWRAFAVGLMFLLAALCKEMAVGFAFALPLWHFFLDGAGKTCLREYLEVLKRRGDLKVYAAIILFGLVYLFLRYQALGLIYTSAYYADSTRFTFSQHLALIGLSIFKYLTLLLFPLGKINVAHSLPQGLDFLNIQVVLGFVLLVGIPAFAWVSKGYRAYVIAGFGFVLAGLLPVVGVIPLPRNPGMYFSESFLPFPMALFSLVLVRPVNAIVSPQYGIPNGLLKVVKGGLFAWFLLAVFTVWTTIPVWNNNISLWLWAKSANPRNQQVSNSLSSAYLAAKRYAEAVDEASLGVKLNEKDDVAWNNLALGLNGLGKYSEAESAAQKAINLKPVEIRNRITLARIYYFSKNYKTALNVLKSILDEKPDDISSLVLIANVYKEIGELSQAREYMQKAIQRLPAGRERTVLSNWLENLS